MQHVKLDLNGKAYTYEWADDNDPLEPGDLVWIPGNRVNPDPSLVRVLRTLGQPDYDGPITRILDRDQRKAVGE